MATQVPGQMLQFRQQLCGRAGETPQTSECAVVCAHNNKMLSVKSILLNFVHWICPLGHVTWRSAVDETTSYSHSLLQ